MEDVKFGKERTAGAKRSRDEGDAETNAVTPNGIVDALEPPTKAHKSNALTSPRLASRQATPSTTTTNGDASNSMSPSKNGDAPSTRSRSESLSPSDEDGADDTEDVGADDTEDGDGDGDEDDDMENDNDMDIVGENPVAVTELPTKPPNSAYMIWIQNRRQEIKAADAASGGGKTKTLKEFGAEWASLDDTEKSVWEEKKQALAAAYKAELEKYNAYVAKHHPNGIANGSSADTDDTVDGGDADQAANGVVGHRNQSQMIAAMQIKVGMVKSLTNMFGRDPDTGDVVTKIPKETCVMITKATELFCEWYSRATFDYAKSKKRKTISINDLFIVNERYSQLEFLKAAYSPQLREKVRVASSVRDKEIASSRAAKRQQKRQAEAAASASTESADAAQAASSSENCSSGAKDSSNAAADNQSDNSSTSSSSSSSGKSSKGKKSKPTPVVNPKAMITNFFKKKTSSAPSKQVDESGASTNAADDSLSVFG